MRIIVTVTEPEQNHSILSLVTAQSFLKSVPVIIKEWFKQKFLRPWKYLCEISCSVFLYCHNILEVTLLKLGSSFWSSRPVEIFIF